MRILYDIFFILFALVYLPYLVIKGKYHKDFIQKFGVLPYDLHKMDRPIWIHAVSVGEAAVAAKLAKNIKKEMPNKIRRKQIKIKTIPMMRKKMMRNENH